jgi:hypothetical protein
MNDEVGQTVLVPFGEGIVAPALIAEADNKTARKTVDGQRSVSRSAPKATTFAIPVAARRSGEWAPGVRCRWTELEPVTDRSPYMSKYRMTIAYACLVGMPLVSLVGLLRAGQHLVAPVSIGGTWNVAADFSTLPATPCTTLLVSATQPFLTLAQSGGSVVATVNNVERTTLPGSLHDMTLTIGDTSGVANNTATNCADAIYLDATVDTRDVPRVIAGTVGIRCPGCGAVPFRAVRQQQNDNGSH